MHRAATRRRGPNAGRTAGPRRSVPGSRQRESRRDRPRRSGDAARRRAASLRERSEAAPEDADLALETSRALFLAADARINAASKLALDAGEPQLADVMGVEEALPKEVRAQVLGLTLEGHTLAQRALEREPERADALLYRALHLSLEAWARGPVAAVTEGLARRVPASIQEAIDADRSLEAAAPLRLLGRFLDKAPWPVGDRKRARELLEEACSIAPTPVNQLYLGDVYWRLDQHDEARDAWRAPPRPPMLAMPGESWHRELAERRLAKS